MIRTFNFEEHVHKLANVPFVCTKGTTITFQEFAGQVKAIRQNLDLSTGSVVIIRSLPAFNYPALLFALWLEGLIAFPVNPSLPETVVQLAIQQTNCRLIIDDNLLFTGSDHPPLHSASDLLQSKSGIIKDAHINPGNISTIIMTGGSTGESKYAALSFGNHYYSAQGANRVLNVDKGDRWLLSLPVYHVSGLSIIVRAFLSGSTLFTTNGDLSLSQAILVSLPTHLSLVPSQLYDLMKIPKCLDCLRKCKAIHLGGSAIPLKLLSYAVSQGLNVFTSYGLTETGSAITCSKWQGDSNVRHSGKIIPFRNIKIDQQGEILVKGETLFKGYFEKGFMQTALLDNGWFATGDFGQWSENEELIVLGRKDNMIVSGGENIHPREIEYALHQIDGIEQAFVIPKEDSKFGQRPVAFVKMSSSVTIDETAIKNLLRKTLVNYKIPDRILALPQSAANGLKVNLKALKEIADTLSKTP